MIPGFRVANQWSRRCAGIAAHIDRDLILGVGIQDDHEVVSLEGMGKAAGGALLLRRQRGGCTDDRKQIVRAAYGRVWLQPVVTAKGAATRVERALHHLLDETGIGRIDAKCLPAPDGGIERPVGHILTGGDQDAVGRRADLSGRRIFSDDGGAVGIGNVKIASADSDQHKNRQQSAECSRCHGQNPKSIEKKKLRLGGKGATSIFRTIAWLAKLLTSGSSPRYGVNRSRFRPVTDRRAYRTPPPNSLLVNDWGTL